MSPTVFRDGAYRAFFFSREEERMHVHVACPDGEAKFWLEPLVALATHVNLTRKQLAEMQALVEERYDEIEEAWTRHFRAHG